MALIEKNTSSKGSGFPELGTMDAKRGGITIDTSGFDGLASLNGGNALTTVLDIAAGSYLIDSLFIVGYGTAVPLTLPRVRITINGEVKFDGNIYVSSATSMWFIGRGFRCALGSYDGAAFVGAQYKINSLKVEIDSTGETNQTHVLGNIQELKR